MKRFMFKKGESNLKVHTEFMEVLLDGHKKIYGFDDVADLEKFIAQLFGCSATFAEFMIIDNTLFKRDDGYKDVDENAGNFFYKCTPQDVPMETPYDIVCQCECIGMSLTYGGYEILATCLKCGRTESVYSG